jgi:superfamily I DNA/RNA helicase
LEEASNRRLDGALRGALQQLARFHAFNPSGASQQNAARLRNWASSGGRSPFLTSLRTLIDTLPGTVTGDPIQDLTTLVALLERLNGDYVKGCTELLLLRLPGSLESNVRQTLRDGFAELGNYTGATAVGHNHLVRERMYDHNASRRPLSLMTLHKCKVKEFDAVVLGEAAQSPGRFLNSDEARLQDWPKSRRLLHVAITRARQRAILLTPAYDISPLLRPFIL